MLRSLARFGLLLVLVAVPSAALAAPSGSRMIGVNVVLNTDVTDAILADLGSHGRVRDVLYEVDAVTMQARESELPAIQALPYVAAANPDAERKGFSVSYADQNERDYNSLKEAIRTSRVDLSSYGTMISIFNGDRMDSFKI